MNPASISFDQMTSGELPKNGFNKMEKLDSPADPTADVKPSRKEKEKKKKKKSGAFGLFKAALSMMRERPKDPKSFDKSTPAPNANWTKLVDSVRPLHSQENIPSPPPSVKSESSPAENIKEIIIPPDSPAPSSSSAGTMSQYASAASLRDLVDSSDDDEEEDPDEVFDALTGDELIDAKAEEFIAQFYNQIRLQNKGKHH